MRCLAAFGTHGSVPAPIRKLPTVAVDGVRVHCAIVNVVSDDDASLSTLAPHAARIHVRAVALNFRDKMFLMETHRVPPGTAIALGSDFVGDVVAVGADVTTLYPGDQVIPNHSFGEIEGSHTFGARGVATNESSREFLVLPEDKLTRVPRTMSHDVAAAFSLGAQTAFAMVRRAQPESRATALVTAGSSNTSLFLISALRARGVTVICTTTSSSRERRLLEHGADSVIVGSVRDGTLQPALADARRRVGGFHYVFDPFFDVYLAACLPKLRPGGQYVTCGLAAQNDAAREAYGARAPDAYRALSIAIVNNLTLHGSCLGTTMDLRNALDEHERGRLPVAIDSIFFDDRIDSGAAFLERSFIAPDRFGRVILRYGSTDD